MALGRGFESESDRAAGASPVAVISDAYWARRFDRAPSAIGATLLVGGRAVTIVGITAAGFAGLAPGDAIDVTLPLSMWLLDEPGFLAATDSLVGMPIVVRLKPGVTAAAASQAVAATFASFMAEPFNAEFRSAPNGQARGATLRPAGRGDDDLRAEYATSLRVLTGMVGLVLLIACVNVANLLVVRGRERAREVAVRLSIGASRRRVLAQFVTEGVVLSAAGGAIAFFIAVGVTAAIARLLRAGMEPIVLDVQPGGAVLIFTAATALLVGVAFSAAPALSATRLDLTPALKGMAAPFGRRRWNGRDLMMASQVAICLVVVFGAGLLVRTLQNLRTVEMGFDTKGVVVFALDARDTAFPAERLGPLCAELVAGLSERPDVVAGTCSTMTPRAPSSEGRAPAAPGIPPRPNDPPFVYANSIDAGYFATFGMQIVAGRGLMPTDRAGSPRVAVVSESLARHYFGQADPTGRTFRWGRRDVRLTDPVTIVGVVRDARRTLREEPPLMVYTPLGQRAGAPADLLAALRTDAAGAAVTTAVRERMRRASGDVALTYVRSMDEQIDASLVSERLVAALSSSFGALALLLACVGVYGRVAYDVSRRRRDIGIRMALGATPGAVLASVLRRSVLMAGAGIGAGAIGAALVSSVISRVLFGVEPRDPVTLTIAGTLLAATALAAAWLPARRAAGVDPATALRTE
jgi:predicted permease